MIYEKDSNKIDNNKTHSLSILVDNEAGALARVVGMFSARGYNIDSLTVAQVETDENLSRITITTSATERVIDKIKAQLRKISTCTQSCRFRYARNICIKRTSFCKG